MLKIGLTGGVASGKSLVAHLLGELGAGLIDTDVAAREVTEPGEPALDEIRAAYGRAVIGSDGRLDRRTLRSLVFDDPDARRRLETILHPRIRARVLEKLERLEAPYAVLVVPLLVETNFGALVDRVLVVDCPVETQLSRLTARDGIDEALARAMIGAQAERSTRLAAADDVIDNGGDAAATRAQVKRLHRFYLSLATDVCPSNRGRAE
ncbi:MAG TPA: dephospho-CoA kinase [Gammaproteobacteria bacterium]|nr:dephospho-CoA kinase [Gammaproteobacteria bacterium]